MRVCTHKTLHKSVQTFLFCFTSNTLISLTTPAWLKDTFSSSHWFQQSYLRSFLPSVLREHEMCYSAFTSQMDITSARTSFEFNLQQEKAKQITWYCTSHIVQTWNTEISPLSDQYPGSGWQAFTAACAIICMKLHNYILFDGFSRNFQSDLLGKGRYISIYFHPFFTRMDIISLWVPTIYCSSLIINLNLKRKKHNTKPHFLELKSLSMDIFFWFQTTKQIYAGTTWFWLVRY